MRVRLHLPAALLLVLMAVSHGLGTADAVRQIEAAGIAPTFARALTVLWLNGALLPALLAVVLLGATFRWLSRRRLAGLVACVTALQAVGAAYVAGPTFFGVWVIAAAAALIALGLVGPAAAETRGSSGTG